MKISPIYKKYLSTWALFWAACFILLVFSYLIFVGPQEQTKQQLTDQIEEKKQLLEVAEKSAEPAELGKLEESAKQINQRLSDFVIEPHNTSDLIFDISRLAHSKQVESFSVRSRDRANTEIPQIDLIEKNEVSISFVGGFLKFAELLNELERNNPIVFIDSFRIGHSIRRESMPSAEMDLQVFVRKREQADR